MIKIAKALKLKNQLAGEVAELKQILASQNVRSTRQKFDYNNQEVLARLRAKVDELVRVKAAIASANAAIYDRIFRLAELKGLVATLSALETKNGVFLESAGYAASATEVEYVAQIGKIEADRLVAALKEEIQSLQDSLDEFKIGRAHV